LRFGFADVAALPARADAALVAALRRRGALWVAPALAQRISDGELLPAGGRDELALRAAAVAVVAHAQKAASAPLSAAQIGFWLAANAGSSSSDDAKDNVVPMHRVRDTVFY